MREKLRVFDAEQPVYSSSTVQGELGNALLHRRATMALLLEDRWFLDRAPGWGYPTIIIEKLAAIVKGQRNFERAYHPWKRS